MTEEYKAAATLGLSIIQYRAAIKEIRHNFARRGGKSKSAAKSAAARRNGKRGGRPKVVGGRIRAKVKFNL